MSILSSLRKGFRAQHRAVQVLIVVVLAAAVVLALALGSLYLIGTIFYYDSYSSDYTYELTVDVDGPADEVIVYAPAPVQDGEVQVGELYVWEHAGLGVEDWSFDVVETEHGPMLEVTLSGVEADASVDVIGDLESDRTIDTREPRGNEPVLSPMSEVGERPVDTDRFPDYRAWDVTSTAYVEHSGDEDVTVGIWTSHEGANTWWSGGWGGNYYTSEVSTYDTTPDPDGEWIDLSGSHRQGFGSYGGILPPPPR